MDSIISRLQEAFKDHPESSSLRTALSHLSELRAGHHTWASNASSWDLIKHDFDLLEAEGVWSRNLENDRLLQDLHSELAGRKSDHGKSDSHKGLPSPNNITLLNPPMPHTGKYPVDGQNVPIAIPPPFSAPLLPLSWTSTTILPVEMIDILNHAYFLHVLATEPSKVLPPGKSLLSVMIRPSVNHEHDPNARLRERVETFVHKVFWDEALESLSNPVPSVELPRLKRLYEDIHVALAPLLPPQHPVLVTLSSPLSPTSSPLLSAITHLREVLYSLRERCAPARDEYIDSLVHKLDDPPNLETPRVVVETVRDILALAETLKEDLSEFVLGGMGEQQLQAVISAQAKEKEREVILSLWRSERIESLWEHWSAELVSSPPQFVDTTQSHSDHHTLTLRILQALGTNISVSCNMPILSAEVQTTSETHLESLSQPRESELVPNALPPPLFFITPTLIYIQNYLQALVIAASLRSLVRIPQSSSPRTTNALQIGTTDHDFMHRIWTLLKTEVDGEPGSGDTKLVNFADEVIRTRRMFGGGKIDGSIDSEEEAKLRAAVDRTLQPRDPVFILLQKRLLKALSERLLARNQLQSDGHKTVAPVQMQTGREASKKAGAGVGMRLDLNGVGESHGFVPFDQRKEQTLVVKGFEDHVLVDAVTEVLGKLRGCMEWTVEVWGDVIKND